MRRIRHSVGLFLLLAVTIGVDAQSAASELARRGERALARESYYEAVESFQRALDENPNYLDAALGLAEAYFWLEEYDRAQHFVDRAARLARTNPRVLNLAGRVAIGRGDLAAAEASFRRVQELEPHNVEAVIGRAELALARGQSVEAVSNLERALRLHPEQRRALLSLVLVYEYLGQEEVARRYLDLALAVHRDRPEVHVLAAQYYLRSGDLARAAAAARTAQAIDPLNRAAMTMRAQVALAEGSYLEAATIAEELIAGDRSDVSAWYMRAIALLRLGELDDALSSARTGLRLSPEDEMLRIWTEWVAVERLELDHPLRSELARVRASNAAELERAFRYERALKAYRRALQLAPLDLEVRRAYAELFRKVDARATYVQELRLLLDEGYDDRRVVQTVEVFANALAQSVSSRWGIDQFTLARARPPVAFYLRTVESDRYPESEEALLAFLRRTIAGLDRLVLLDAAVVPSYADAFARARSHDVYFFIHTDVAVSELGVEWRAGVYVARTGALAEEFMTIRTGPDRAAAGADAFADALVRAIPGRGVILQRDVRRAVVDLGMRDGVSPGDRFDIVRPQAVRPAPDALAYAYRPEDVAGTLVITAVDDLISEGTLEVNGFVDMIRVGHAVLAERQNEPVGSRSAPPAGFGSPSQDLFPVLHERVRRLR